MYDRLREMDLHILEKERVGGDYIAFYYSWMGGSREDGYRQMVRRWSQKCMVTGQDIWNRTQSMDSRNTEICFSYAKWHTVALSQVPQAALASLSSEMFNTGLDKAMSNLL